MSKPVYCSIPQAQSQTNDEHDGLVRINKSVDIDAEIDVGDTISHSISASASSAGGTFRSETSAPGRSSAHAVGAAFHHDFEYAELGQAADQKEPNSVRAPICELDEFHVAELNELRRLSLLPNEEASDAGVPFGRAKRSFSVRANSGAARRFDRGQNNNQYDQTRRLSFNRRSRPNSIWHQRFQTRPPAEHNGRREPICGPLILDENFVDLVMPNRSQSLSPNSAKRNALRRQHLEQCVGGAADELDLKQEHDHGRGRGHEHVNVHEHDVVDADITSCALETNHDGDGDGDGDDVETTLATATVSDGGQSPPSKDAEQRQNAINTALGVASNNATRTLKDQLISFFQPSDNKLAMKLFGNKNALLKERKRQQQSGFSFVIHPCSDFRFYWDLIMLMVLGLNVVILPVAIAFFYEDVTAGWIAFNCISDCLFVLDIFCNFRTGVITSDFAEQILLDPKAIAWHYIKTWFFLDLVSSLPIDYILLVFNSDDNYNQLMHAGRALRILRLAKLLSLLRLLRFSRLVRYMSQWEEFLNIAAMLLRVLNLVLLILLLAHWNACLQFLIPALKDFPPDSWVALEEIERAPWVTQYTWSMFRALSHMLCIGYGKYPPQSMADAWSTMVSMLSGAISYAMFVGHATALVQSFDTSKRMYREKWKQVEEYMAFRKLPRNLRQRISNYYEHRYQGKMFDEDAILGELSECLREQIINYNCRALVAAVPYFTHADADFVSEVVTSLHFEVFQPEDIVIKAGTIGTKMYFIQEGTVEVILPNGTVATSLHDGAYFGEICLLVEGARRVATIKAVTYCNLYSLSNESFKQVLENYPSMRLTMEQVAQERLHKIGVNTSKLAAPSASDSGQRLNSP